MNAPAAAGLLLDGRYRVGPVLARGGMSTVYRGTDQRLDRPVAIKIMDPRLAADPAFRTRIEREARAAARIDHPAVVNVFDQGEDQGAEGPVLFLVMELVEGGTLRDVLRARGAVGVPAAFAVMEQVLSGLAQAHRLGLVHRDVKPENVLISPSRQLKVADFGLVTAGASVGASHAGMIMGTVAYLSPEQVETGAADARSDVYAAGLMLYELLTGTPPYTGETALSVAYRHVHSDVPPPSLIAGDVPPELDELVLTATRRDPAARPPDAAALLDQLHRVAVLLEVPRVPVPVPPPRPVVEQPTLPPGVVPPQKGGTRTLPREEQEELEPTPRPSRRRWIAIGTAIALTLVLAGSAGLWWLNVGRWTAMPSLLGIERAAAERILADADLIVAVTTSQNDNLAAGLVAATDPAPEARLLRGSTVTITVSAGRPTVPTIAAGTSVAEAEVAIRSAGLRPIRATGASEYSDTVPGGAVIRTQPAAGTVLPINGNVTLVLSVGAKPADVSVPLLVGAEITQALAQLQSLGLQGHREDKAPFGISTGRVIQQSHAPGTQVPPGTTITLITL